MSHGEELLRAFRIGPDDLRANRLNRLGPGQLRRLRRNIWVNVLAATPVQLGLIAIVVFVPRRPLFLYLVIGALVLALAAVEYDWVRKIRRVIRAGVVSCLSGPVTVHSAGRGGTWLTVQGERNRLWTGYWHVGRGRPYRVYVAPAARLIVAPANAATITVMLLLPAGDSGRAFFDDVRLISKNRLLDGGFELRAKDGSRSSGWEFVRGGAFAAAGGSRAAWSFPGDELVHVQQGPRHQRPGGALRQVVAAGPRRAPR